MSPSKQKFEEDLAVLRTCRAELKKVHRRCRQRKLMRRLQEFTEVTLLHILFTLLYSIAFPFETQSNLMRAAILAAYGFSIFLIYMPRRPDRPRAHWVQG